MTLASSSGTVIVHSLIIPGSISNSRFTRFFELFRLKPIGWRQQHPADLLIRLQLTPDADRARFVGKLFALIDRKSKTGDRLRMGDHVKTLSLERSVLRGTGRMMMRRASR